MNLFIYPLSALFFFLSCVFVYATQDLEWSQVKGQHFIVCYDNPAHRSVADSTLMRAEDSYNKVVARIGYARYSQFWTWGDRVKIFLFSDHQAFLDQTRLPEWSRAGAFHAKDSDQRIIVSYSNQPRFFSEVLPHEIAHLVLKDFVGLNRALPCWFSEGVAQLAEQDKVSKADTIMRISARLNAFFPFDILASYDVVNEKDEQRVALFYAQSVSMVDFLIRRFGSEKFALWCRQIASGRGFDEAFRIAYGAHLQSLKSFEIKWLDSLRH